MERVQIITPCLWFDDQAEEVVRFYASIFKNSRIVKMPGRKSMEKRREHKER